MERNPISSSEKRQKAKRNLFKEEKMIFAVIINLTSNILIDIKINIILYIYSNLLIIENVKGISQT